ncbi:MAG: hypothetical protein ABI728_09985 [Betaproteobacteria bacterium]
MDAAEVTSLVAELFATIHLLSGYPVPEGNPEVRFLALATMQQMICKRACAVKAFYKPGEGVFIEEKIDVKDDIYSCSVPMHELVHHLQHESGKFDNLDTPCHRWQAKEVEAYEIQHKYLKKMRVTRSFISLDTVPITRAQDSKAGAAGN